jgi:FkbM family methyltransferase
MHAKPNWKALLNRLHRWLGRSRRAAGLALKIHNQTHCILGYALGEDAEVTDDLNSENWLIQQYAHSSKVFVDVGANRGDWTALFLQESKGPRRGLLFEPVPELAAKLKERFQDQCGIEIVNAAISDQEGQMEFFVEPGDGKTSSLARGATSPRARKYAVSVTTLDTAAKKAGLSGIDFLKIDAEGYDLNVLKGAQGLLARHAINVLQFEYGVAWPHANNTLATALALLHVYEYSTYLLRSKALYRFDYQKYGEYFRYSTFVAASPEVSGSLDQLLRGEI